jgi:ferritin-like protein
MSSRFAAVAIAAGLIKPGQTFDVYANENNFLQGAFTFEDVGVTAFKGAAPLISNKTLLSAAAGIIAVEAYHAGTIRTVLFDRSLARQANAISDARDSLDGPSDDDQGIILNGTANIVPADSNSVAFGRTPGRVLNVVYLTPKRWSPTRSHDRTPGGRPPRRPASPSAHHAGVPQRPSPRPPVR